MAGGGGKKEKQEKIDIPEAEIDDQVEMSGGGMVPQVVDAQTSAKNFIQKYNQGGLVQHLEEGGSPQPTAADFGLREDFDFDNPEHQKEFVEIISPHLKNFMEQQNAAVDENPEAYNGIKLKMDRDGKMPNFGEFIANQSESAFNNSVGMVQSNESIPLDARQALMQKMTMIKKETLDNPNFKGDMAFDINKDIPGTAANRLYMEAQQNQTGAAAKSGAFSPEDLARLRNRRGMNKGGVVPGSGNEDTVPAMLTPGEFVMSKGAVNKYGSDTLESMNSAAGSAGSGGSKGDTVPAMLTPGEFVVSAPAVQKFGVNTMESMNLKGGGNNKPELKEPNIEVNNGGLISDYRNMKTNHYYTGGLVQYLQGGGEVNKPGGWKRWGLGALDFMTGGLTDFDKRGSMADGAKRMAEKMAPGTPVQQGENKTITLPTIPKQDQTRTRSNSDVPMFRIPIQSAQRSLVLSSLGIQDLIGGS